MDDFLETCTNFDFSSVRKANVANMKNQLINPFSNMRLQLSLECVPSMLTHMYSIKQEHQYI